MIETVRTALQQWSLKTEFPKIDLGVHGQESRGACLVFVAQAFLIWNRVNGTVGAELAKKICACLMTLYRDEWSDHKKSLVETVPPQKVGTDESRKALLVDRSIDKSATSAVLPGSREKRKCRTIELCAASDVVMVRFESMERAMEMLGESRKRIEDEIKKGKYDGCNDYWRYGTDNYLNDDVENFARYCNSN